MFNQLKNNFKIFFSKILELIDINSIIELIDFCKNIF